LRPHHTGWASIATGSGNSPAPRPGRSVEFHDGLRLLDYHLSVCGEAAHLALLSGQQTLPIKEVA
jgi:hypothetical protein